MRTSFSSITIAGFGLLSCLLDLAWAIDGNDLNIKLYEPLAEEGWYMWNAILQLSGNYDTVLSDGQLVGIAQLGYDQIRNVNWFEDNKHKPPWKGLGQPKAFTVLAKDNYLYLSSTVKIADNTKPGKSFALSGAQDFFLPYQLVRCQEQLQTTKPHRADANCAEPMAANLFWRFQKDGPLDLTGGKMVTWGWNKGSAPNSIKDPCLTFTTLDDVSDGDDEMFQWGCTAFVQKLGVTLIDKATAKLDPPADLQLTAQEYCLLPESL